MTETELIKLAQAGNKEARDTLIMQNRPYAVKCALKAYRSRKSYCGSTVDMNDLIQECMIAIMKAIDRCDVDKLNGRPIRWYAKLPCRNAIEDTIGNAPLVRIPPTTLWHYRHGNMSKRGMVDVEDRLKRKTGAWAHKASEKRLGPADEAAFNELVEKSLTTKKIGL